MTDKEKFEDGFRLGGRACPIYIDGVPNEVLVHAVKGTTWAGSVVWLQSDYGKSAVIPEHLFGYAIADDDPVEKCLRLEGGLEELLSKGVPGFASHSSLEGIPAHEVIAAYDEALREILEAASGDPIKIGPKP